MDVQTEYRALEARFNQERLKILPLSGNVPTAGQVTLRTKVDRQTAFRSHHLQASSYAFDTGVTEGHPRFQTGLGNWVPPSILEWAAGGLFARIEDEGAGIEMTSGFVPLSVIAAPSYDPNFIAPRPWRYVWKAGTQIAWTIKNMDVGSQDHRCNIAMFGYEFDVKRSNRLSPDRGGDPILGPGGLTVNDTPSARRSNRFIPYIYSLRPLRDEPFTPDNTNWGINIPNGQTVDIFIRLDGDYPFLMESLKFMVAFQSGDFWYFYNSLGGLRHTTVDITRFPGRQVVDGLDISVSVSPDERQLVGGHNPTPIPGRPARRGVAGGVMQGSQYGLGDFQLPYLMPRSGVIQLRFTNNFSYIDDVEITPDLMIAGGIFGKKIVGDR